MNTIHVQNNLDKQMAYSIKQITQLVPVSRSFIFEQIRLNKRITSAEVIRIAIREKDANLNSWS